VDHVYEVGENGPPAFVVRKTRKEQVFVTQKNTTDDREQTSKEEVLAYPFPLADHSLELENPAIYERLQRECPVAHVHLPVGGDAFLLTRHADVAKALGDPRCGIIQESDGDFPRRGRGRGPGAGNEMPSLFSVSDARHNHMRRLVTQWFTVKRANELAPRVAEVTNALVDAMERSGPPADLFEDYAIKTPMTVIYQLGFYPVATSRSTGTTARAP
jgi:cytochrome P450